MDNAALLEALGRAIDAETLAREFYAAAATRTGDPGGAAMFRELAEFEEHHRARLESVRASLVDGNGWISSPSREFSRPPLAEAGQRSASGDRTGPLEALRMAIVAEERAESEYRSIAAAMGDFQGRQMFERLAQEEAMHRKLLDEQFTALANRGSWFWND